MPAPSCSGALSGCSIAPTSLLSSPFGSTVSASSVRQYFMFAGSGDVISANGSSSPFIINEHSSIIAPRLRSCPIYFPLAAEYVRFLCRK